MHPAIDDYRAELAQVKTAARNLVRAATRWGVEIPLQWYVTDDEDGESFIGGLYHQALAARIQAAKCGLT